MSIEGQFDDILQLVRTLKPETGADKEKFDKALQMIRDLKEASVGEIDTMMIENNKLQRKVGLLSKGNKATRPSRDFSVLAMADAVRMAKNPAALEGLSDVDVEEHDGMSLTESVALDPSKSTYATGYDYGLLKAKEVLITLHDVKAANSAIDEGPGMWANYILNKERNSTLKVVNRKQLKSEGKYYHLKSIRDGLEIDKLINFCKNKGIRAIVPTSVSDEIYLATHMKDLHAHDIHPFCCEDPQSYVTLDHKWLSYQFCLENGIAQAETLPLRVDTADACRELVAKTTARGVPCFVKECFDTCAGDGVIKVDRIDDYDDAIKRITMGKGPQPADTVGATQHIIVQAGHPGRICCCQNIFYKGNLVSLYVTKENEAMIGQLGNLRLEMAMGTWSAYNGDLSMSFKLDLDDPSDRNVRDQATAVMTKVGRMLNYTGMLEVEFIIEDDPDAVLNVLEFNPRFSGACHDYVGSGMVQDYMNILGMIATTGDDTNKVMQRASMTHIRSDTHKPKGNFKDYNAVKFYMPQPVTILNLRKI